MFSEVFYSRSIGIDGVRKWTEYVKRLECGVRCCVTFMEGNNELTVFHRNQAFTSLAKSSQW